MFKPSSVIAAACMAGLLGFAPDMQAQPMQPGQTAMSVSLTGINQFKTRMNEGGHFDWYDATVGVRLNHQFSAQWGAGLSAEYGYQRWSWYDPVAFGGQVPWQSIEIPQIGFSVTYSPTPRWRLTVSPSVEWAAESGVGTSGASTYGAVFLATHTVSRGLTLGVGAGVFRQIDENRVFPFLAINWQITNRLALRNPLPAGPAGGAGLELTYQFDDRWNFGVGGAYRSYRFRLNDSGPFAGGVGQNRLIPVFARVSYQLLPGTRVDLYGVASTGGNVQARSADASQSLNTNYNTGLGLGLNLTHRF
jgi:hypothetical protein